MTVSLRKLDLGTVIYINRDDKACARIIEIMETGPEQDEIAEVIRAALEKHFNSK